MINALTDNHLRGSISVRAIVLSMILSAAALGCTTNYTRTAGEPDWRTPAGGSVTPSLSATPGSAGPSIPSTMISAAVDPSVDAMAVLEANRGFEGRVLGPADPGTGTPELSRQYATGQFIPPSWSANPQLTVNSSISSSPVPSIVNDAGFGVGEVGTAIVAGATTAGTLPGGLTNVGNAVATSGANANFGVTGLSNTTATGLTSVTTATTNIAGGTNQVVSTGVAAAPSTASSVLATPTLGTAPRLSVDNTATVRATGPGTSSIDRSGIAANTVTTGTGANVRVVTINGRVVVTNQP